MNNKAEDGKYSCNVQIYTFLWFWFIILAAITGIFLIYRFFVVLAPGIRAALIQVFQRMARNLGRKGDMSSSSVLYKNCSYCTVACHVQSDNGIFCFVITVGERKIKNLNHRI